MDYLDFVDTVTKGKVGGGESKFKTPPLSKKELEDFNSRFAEFMDDEKVGGEESEDDIIDINEEMDIIEITDNEEYSAIEKLLTKIDNMM